MYLRGIYNKQTTKEVSQKRWLKFKVIYCLPSEIDEEIRKKLMCNGSIITEEVLVCVTATEEMLNYSRNQVSISTDNLNSRNRGSNANGTI